MDAFHSHLHFCEFSVESGRDEPFRLPKSEEMKRCNAITMKIILLRNVFILGLGLEVKVQSTVFIYISGLQSHSMHNAMRAQHCFCTVSLFLASLRLAIIRGSAVASTALTIKCVYNKQKLKYKEFLNVYAFCLRILIHTEIMIILMLMRSSGQARKYELFGSALYGRRRDKVFLGSLRQNASCILISGLVLVLVLCACLQ